MDLPVASDELIESRILEIRGHRVILDEDIAALYEVDTGQLVRAVLRNADRFPSDFMFRLTSEEFGELRRALDRHAGRGGRRQAPYAFTEHGVAMLSGVLRSPRAVAVNVEIVRAFVRLRGVLSAHRDLAHRLDELESKYDQRFAAVFEALRQLMAPSEKPRRPIGFTPPDQGSSANR
jgi:hypothetical protein